MLKINRMKANMMAKATPIGSDINIIPYIIILISSLVS